MNNFIDFFNSNIDSDLFSLLEGQISTIAFENWIFDEDHGYQHCLSVLYLAYKMSNELNLSKNLIMSCMIHDIMRFVSGDYGHDFALHKISKKLLPETYWHTNPIAETPLILADRLELLRFNDNSWIDFNLLSNSILAYGGANKVDEFFNFVRPQLILKNRQLNGEIFVKGLAERIIHPNQLQSLLAQFVF